MIAPPPSPGPPPRLRRGLAIASFVLGVLSLPTCGLAILGALYGIRLGVEAVVKARKAPQEYGGKGLAVAGIVTNVVALFLALVVMPKMLRSNTQGNEAGTIGDIRAVISAEMAYRAVNGGFYDTLDCLGTPGPCLPSYHGPAFLDASLASLRPAHGYDRSFHAGPSPAQRPRKGFSPSSLQSFAYVAVPISRSTGSRAFCGDNSGRVCFTPGVAAPPVVDGQCPTSCTPVP